MSRKVNVQFQVNSMAIMRSTLTEMGMEFSEKNNAISVKRSYHPITINGDTGEISYDSDNEREVKLIKQNWYFCYNDWHASAIARDLDRIAEIGADHIRVMLVWPWFQPNPNSVSAAHLGRLDQLLRLAAERNLDVLVTLYTGWLSGFSFTPPFLERRVFESMTSSAV